MENREALRNAASDLLQLRRVRKAHLGERLTGPAWDLLLALYTVADARSACSIAKITELAGLPPTTALRRLHQLEENGLVRRSGAEHDHRVVEVSLTDRGLQVMATILAARVPR